MGLVLKTKPLLFALPLAVHFCRAFASERPLTADQHCDSALGDSGTLTMAMLRRQVFDRFFCSHPGPTWPNRLFQLMATSNGCTETNNWDPGTFLYKGRTVFDIVEEAGHDWHFCK